MTPREFEGSRRGGRTLVLQFFSEVRDGGENINNGIENALVIPLLIWNGEDIEEKEGDQNGLNVQGSEYIQNKVGRWMKRKRMGETDYGTTGEMEATVGWNCSMQLMYVRCNVASSWI